MRAVRQRSRPVRDVEVERLAREALELDHSLKSELSADTVNMALTQYRKVFGVAATLKFVHTVKLELWEKHVTR